ncbi:MAG: NADH-quinone oxidoreductase subunit C [Candidatus Hodarchaeota archaeon]
MKTTARTDYELALALGSALAQKIQDVVVIRPGHIAISVPALKMLDVAIQLRDEFAFDQVISVSGVDYLEQDIIAVVYHIVARKVKTRRQLVVELKTQIPRDQPRLHTLAFVWPSAEFLEREAHELLGIQFNEHPNLGPLLLPEDWEGGWPLRKDFTIPSKEEERE